MRGNNKGYATLEITLIMPLLVLLAVMIICIFIDSINDGASRAESYEFLYTYTKDDGKMNSETGREYSFSHMLIGGASTEPEVSDSGGEVKVSLYHMARKVSGGYTSGSRAEYKTEYDKTTGRLRRWQLYGDYLWE